MPDVIVYLSSILKKTPGRKTEVLLAFAEGARQAGADVRVETEYVYTPAKLAVILGWPSPEQTSPNIKLRAEIVDRQQQSGNHVMCIDGNCFKFLDQTSKYLRYSLDSPYYDTGEYANKNSNADRWNQLSQDISVGLTDWKTTGDYILLLLQRNGGFGMKGLDPIKWAQDKIKSIRQYTNMPIVIRPHPGKISDTSVLVAPGITISDSKTRSLMLDLKHARAAFVFNSSSGVAAILAGVPLWVDDPSSVCWAVANTDIGTLTNPAYPDRTQWLHDLAACHWTDEESRAGLIYKKFIPYLV